MARQRPRTYLVETFDDPIQRQRQLQAHLLERRGKAAAIWQPDASEVSMGYVLRAVEGFSGDLLTADCEDRTCQSPLCTSNGSRTRTPASTRSTRRSISLTATVISAQLRRYQSLHNRGPRRISTFRSISSKHTAASRVPTVLGSLVNCLWKQMAGS